MTEYHVSKNGNDKNNGSEQNPFFTISRAALAVGEGDKVIVHEGIYRETVRLYRIAREKNGPVIFEAPEDEKVVIKGSQPVKSWEKVHKTIWKTTINNSFFGEYNPYIETIDGDWLMEPFEKPLHTGQVYVDGAALREVGEYDALDEMKWYASVQEAVTEIYADFGEINPNTALTEINVRESCFAAMETGVNYITIKGFELAHAATKWSPPTAEQSGMICANWCKGWIIENNIIHDARCSAICIGKEGSTGHNIASRYGRKPGYQTQLEAVFSGKRAGWKKETVGSHRIRNNIIYDCGQNAIVGNMGGAFSEICHNHIYNIGNLHEFFGFEIAGIKLHAAIDTYIHHNKIHDCLLGTWLDWQAQGVRLSSNLYYNNETDVWIEVTHGPHLVDNNIFGSEETLRNAAQGGAYIHNLFCGRLSRYDVTDRSTPYHLPHSTEIMGTAVVYGGDDRFYQNIFIGDLKNRDENKKYGTEDYNGYCSSLEEYIQKVRANGRGDIEKFKPVRQPAYINNNMYLSGAVPYDKEKHFYSDERDCHWSVEKENGRVYFHIDFPENAFSKSTKIINTHSLDMPRITGQPFEAPDGSDIVLDVDFFGTKRSIHPTPGPFEGLQAGKHTIVLDETRSCI